MLVGAIGVVLIGIIVLAIKSLRKSLREEDKRIQEVKDELKKCNNCSHLVEKLND
ncbi:hypothetical protein ACPV3A_14515 [Paenibacillus sp. Dod16]|uniref:hypothetical protein n=1 Tax=Paenibacillus sp. Dod16 TaxID=3416392 RepID=UPI003CE84D4A